MVRKSYYVHCLGCYASFTKDEFLSCLEQSIVDDAAAIPDRNLLTSKPAFIKKDKKRFDDDSRPKVYSTDKNRFVYDFSDIDGESLKDILSEVCNTTKVRSIEELVTTYITNKKVNANNN